VGDFQHLGPTGNNQTACNPFRIFSHASFEPDIRVNSANGSWWQFHHWYVWIAKYRQCQRGILIQQQRQLHFTHAPAHWLVYWSWLYRGDTVISCTPWLVQYLLCKSFQPMVHYQYMAKYTQSTSVTSPTIDDEPSIRPVSQQVYHWRETHICRVCRSIKLTTLRDESEDFGIPNCW